MRLYKFILTIIFCLVTSLSFAADYTIATGTSTFNGATDCGGACTSADTIIIAGGARGYLTISNLDGSGSYITVTNENATPDARVVITSSGGLGALILDDCQYVDLKGSNDPDLTYGIKVINDGSPDLTRTVGVLGESDYIKISYLEISCEGSSSSNGNGIQIQDGTLTNSSTFSNFEIHHNYIHDTRYAGMYIGHNTPDTELDPYVTNFLIHDNLFEDMGAYGITYKGVYGGTSAIYNNTIKGSAGGASTGLVYVDADGSSHQGIGAQYFYNSPTVNVYSNWIEKTKGPGIKTETNAVGIDIYNNIVLGCGSSNDAKYGQGIYFGYVTTGATVRQNIIIEPYQYAIYAHNAAVSLTYSDNLIGDAGVGTVGGSGTLTNGGGNTVYSAVSSFAFDTWSDDDDYTNDIFGGRGLNPTNGGTDAGTSVTLTGTLFTGVSTVDMYYECGDTSPDVLVVDDGAAISYDPNPDPAESTTCYWQNIYTHGWGTETGAIYSFSTTDVIPPTTGLAPIEIDSGGAPVIINSGGTPIVIGE